MMALRGFITLALLVVHSKSETVVNEVINVNWTNSTPSTQDKHPSLPDNVLLTLTIDNETAELNLTKNQNDNFEDIPVLIGGSGNVTVWHHNRDEQLSVYNDKSKDASFSVVLKKENGTTITEYYGSFVHKEIKYTLTPKIYHEASNKSSDVVHQFNLNGTEYVVFIDKVNKTVKAVDDDVEENGTTYQPGLTTTSGPIQTTDEVLKITTPKPVETSLPKETVSCGNNSVETSRSARRKRNTLTRLIVDVMLIIDYSMYNRWLKMNNQDKDKTVERMRYYLAHVINGVNNVYATMASPKLSISIVEIFIAGTARQSWFFENPEIKNQLEKKRANFNKALAEFRLWVLKHKAADGEQPNQQRFLPNHDIAVAFTDYSESPTEGLAYLGTVCGDHAMGIVHEKGQFDTITCAAHELAHTLGSSHDGTGNYCDPNDHYLMSPVMTNTKIENRDTLSRCTMEQIVNKAMELEWRQLNCMDVRKTQKKKVNLDKLLDPHPGARFSVDEQCQLKFGNLDYKFCSQGEDTASTICNQMKCLNKKDNKCYSGHPLALDGTPCGKGKWCKKGQCVSGAPQQKGVKDKCTFGDKSDGFIFNDVLITCKDVQRQQVSCYTLNKWCCKTCAKIKKDKNTGLPGCEYGDIGMNIDFGGTIRGCEVVFERPDACEQPGINKYCCESCLNVSKSHVPQTPNVPERPQVPETRTTKRPTGGCVDQTNLVMNGMAFNCQSLFRNYALCYDVDKYCCKTCSEIKKIKAHKGISGCAYGDIGARLSINGVLYTCAGVFVLPSMCKTNPDTARLCCESCYDATITFGGNRRYGGRRY